MPRALPLLCLCYCLGIAGGDAAGLGGSGGRAVLAAALGLVLVLLAMRRPLGLALLALACALGAAAQARRPPAPALGRALPAGPWLAEGRLLRAPEPGPAGLALRVALDGGQPQAGGPLQPLAPPVLAALTVRGAPPVHGAPLWPGDRLRLRGVLRPPEGALNPLGGDPRRRAAAEGVQLQLSLDAEALLRLADGERDAPAALRAHAAIARLRARLLSVVGARRGAPAAAPGTGVAAAPGTGVAAALVSALVLGARGGLAALEPPLEDSFRRAGVFHVLSVSGLHLAVASLLCYVGLVALLRRAPWLCRRLPARRVGALCAIPATLLYTALTGAAVATVRAAVVAVLCYGAIACGRRARLGEALAAAVLLLLGILGPLLPFGAPLSLFDPALQLSVAAALGTAELRPRLLPRAAASAGPRPFDPVSRLARLACALTAATVGATVATAPLLALHFGELQGAGLLGNLLVVPLGELLVVPLGLGGALLSLVAPALGGPLLDLAGAAAVAMAAVAEQVAGLGLSWSVPAPSPLVLALFYGALLLLGSGPRLRRAGLALLALCLCAAAVTRALERRDLRATFLDVGQGDAAVLELPGGEVLVVDGGATSGGYDPGARVLLPHLRRRGLRRIDLLVVSHPHPDHAAGLLSLLEEVPVGALWTAEAPPGDGGPPSAGGPGAGADGGAFAPGAAEAPHPTFLQLLAAARRRGVPIERPRALTLGAVRLVPLGPFAGCAPSSARDCAVQPFADSGHNDNSLVLRLEYAGRSLLLTGDLELKGELRLLEHLDRQPALRRADVLKVPHHCSRTSSSESLLREVAPRLALCSLGRHNRYGFPHREVVERYRLLGVPLFRTDLSGALTVRLTAGGAVELEAVEGPGHSLPAAP